MAEVGEVTIKRTESYSYIFIRKKGSYQQMGKAVRALFASAARRALTPQPPLHGVYYNSPQEVPDAELDWELRLPIFGTFPHQHENRRGIGVSRVDAEQVAATIHKGPYDQVGKTYQVLGLWIAKNGYHVCGPAEEVYLNDPRQVAPEELLTEVRLPVTKG
ncbi:MAG: GyrI-like domain-containing protein [Chloroflexi bacterium]|nr:GyrI-like domain-containing protein [Chloroflexota bacterium]